MESYKTSDSASLFPNTIIKLFFVVGLIDEIILEARMIKKSDAGDFKKDDSYINGLPQYSMIIREHIKVCPHYA